MRIVAGVMYVIRGKAWCFSRTQ